MVWHEGCLIELLAVFEHKGWLADYEYDTLYASYSKRSGYMKHTRTGLECTISSDDDQITFQSVTCTRYPFTKKGKMFLEHTKQRLSDEGIAFDWESPAFFFLKRGFDCSALNDLRPHALPGTIRSLFDETVSSTERILFSCAHVLNTYARIEQRKEQMPWHMAELNYLSMFCFFDQEQRLLLH